jgi:hypothetical protein
MDFVMKGSLRNDYGRDESNAFELAPPCRRSKRHFRVRTAAWLYRVLDAKGRVLAYVVSARSERDVTEGVDVLLTDIVLLGNAQSKPQHRFRLPCELEQGAREGRALRSRAERVS